MSAQVTRNSAAEGWFSRLLRVGRTLFYHADAAMNHVFGVRYNVFYALGTIPIFLLVILLFSGLYLFIYYSLSVEMTYDSVHYMTERAPMGSFMRGLHRYAADAMMFFVFLHLVRVFVEGKFQNHRWFPWVTGVILLFLLLVEGVTGYAMPLDTTSRFILARTSEWLDTIGLFGDTLPRAFAMPTLMGKWIMWILLVIHLGIPLGFVLLIYMHLKRISRAKILPNKVLMIAVTVSLCALAIFVPVKMEAAADYQHLPFLERIDWFFLSLAPLMGKLSMGTLTISFLAVFLILVAVPWCKKKPALDKASLDLDHCTGCTACAMDCPYQAIRMQPRSDGHEKYKMEADINPDLCAGCGICVGSCDFGGMHLTDLRQPIILDQIRTAASTKNGDWLLVACQHQVTTKVREALDGVSEVQTLVYPCVGLVGPTFMSEARKEGSAGVVIASCIEGDCHYREGNAWIRERLDGKRKPRLKRAEKQFPIAHLHFNPTQLKPFLERLTLFIKQSERTGVKTVARRLFLQIREGRPFLHYSLTTLILASFFWLFYLGAIRPPGRVPPDTTRFQIWVDFFHQTGQTNGATEVPEEAVRKEIERLSGFVHHSEVDPTSRARLRQIAEETVRRKHTSRSRNPLTLTLYLSGKVVAERVFQPTGVHEDGLVHIHQKLDLPPGSHQLVIKASENLASGEELALPSFTLEQEFEGGRIYFIDFAESTRTFYVRNL